MKKSILLLLGCFYASLLFSQTTPPTVNRAGYNSNVTQADSYLSVIKRFGIPTGATETLEGSTAGANTAKLFYNTVTNKLRIYNPVSAVWRDAIEADLTNYYTKPEVDDLIAAIPEPDLSNYVTLNTAQTITAKKTFRTPDATSGNGSSPIEVIGGSGGNAAGSSGFNFAGSAGIINIKAGKGGFANGSSDTNVGGNGGEVIVAAGDGGQATGVGTLVSGNGGNAVFQAGTAFGNGLAGNAELKAGNNTSLSGGSIFLVTGLGSGGDENSGTGENAGHVYVGISNDGRGRGNTIVGIDPSNQELALLSNGKRLEVRGDGSFTGTVVGANAVENNEFVTLSQLNTKLNASEKGASNGVATLDINSKVPMSQIPDALVGSVNYQGNWNPSTNTPTLPTTPSGATKGHYYISSVTGTFNGVEYNNGDWIISNGSEWGKVDNTNKVVSVNGKQGVVVIGVSDIAGLQGFLDAKASASINLQQVSDNGSSTSNIITAGGFSTANYVSSSIDANEGNQHPRLSQVQGLLSNKADVNGNNATGTWSINVSGTANNSTLLGGVYSAVDAQQVNPDNILSLNPNVAGQIQYTSIDALKTRLGIPSGGETLGSVMARDGESPYNMILNNPVANNRLDISNTYTGQGTALQGKTSDGSAFKSIILQHEGSNVGIGTINPTQRLDVKGSSIIGGEGGVNTNNTKLLLRNEFGRTWALSSGANGVSEGDFAIYDEPTGNTGSLKFLISGGNGNVGIGTTNPVAKLQVSGEGRFTGVGINEAAATFRGINYYTSNVLRFFAAINSDAETGSNSGSNYSIYRYADDGTYLGRSLGINRATGTTTLEGLTVINNAGVAGSLDVSGSITATGGNSTQWNQAYSDRVTTNTQQTITGNKTFTNGLATKNPTSGNVVGFYSENFDGTQYARFNSSMGLNFVRGTNFTWISPTVSGNGLVIQTPTGSGQTASSKISVNSGAYQTSERTVEIDGRASYHIDPLALNSLIAALEDRDLVPKKYVDSKISKNTYTFTKTTNAFSAISISRDELGVTGVENAIYQVEGITEGATVRNSITNYYNNTYNNGASDAVYLQILDYTSGTGTGAPTFVGSGKSITFKIRVIKFQ